MICQHDVTERDVASTADGLCPLCLVSSLERQREVIKALTEAVEHSLIGVYRSKTDQERAVLDTTEIAELRAALTRAKELGE